MLATYDLLTALHTSCASDTLPSPHPPHRGGGGNVDPTSIIYMLATCQLYPTQSLQHTGYIQDHDHEGGGVAGLSHIYICIYIYIMLPSNRTGQSLGGHFSTLCICCCAAIHREIILTGQNAMYPRLRCIFCSISKPQPTYNADRKFGLVSPIQ